MSSAAAGRNKAAEARKRKRTEEAAIDGIVAAMNSQAAKDQDYVIEAMQERPELGSLIAGMIRDGRFDKAQAKAAEVGQVVRQPQDLGRSLGRSVKTFKKLGVSVLQAFLMKIAGGSAPAKKGLSFLLKVGKDKDGVVSEEAIGLDRVGEIWHFALDVNDDTPLPKEHASPGYLNPLLAVLVRRSHDCGNLLEIYKASEALAAPAFWSFNPSGQTPNQVQFRLGSHTKALTLPIAAEKVRSVTDWDIDAPHTFYATLTSKGSFISTPLGTALEEKEAEFCNALPMFDPQERFEYPDAWKGEDGSPAPSTPGNMSTSTSGRPSVPVAGEEVIGSLPALDE